MPRSNDQSEAYSNMDSATREIIEVMTHVKLSGNKTTERVLELIKSEDDLNVLSKWHKSAAKAASIEEFETNM